MSATPIRFRGPLAALGAAARRQLLDRAPAADRTARDDAAAIVADVRARGDDVLRALAQRYDRATLASLEVPREARRAALDRLPAGTRVALERAARNIMRVHEAFRPVARAIEPEPGIRVSRRPVPLATVGIYAPGGRAAYASSVLMGVIPARAAGVREIVVCSPPQPSGLPSDAVLAATELAGADRVFAVGGAGAIAALAYGTESVPRVDLIAGPGNAIVTEAKLLVARDVAIDGAAGPSELLVVTDRIEDASAVAREMLAQAEHDPDAAVAAVCLGDRVADAVERALVRGIGGTERIGTIARALASRGAVLTATTLDEAAEFADAFAPEHLLLAVPDAAALAARIRTAGATFLGITSSVVFGDYLTGANHVLPTQGAGRARSGLSTETFMRWTSVQEVGPEAAARLAADTARLARAEGLPAHADAARALGEAA